MHNGRVSKRRTLNTEGLSDRLFKKLRLNPDDCETNNNTEKQTSTALVIYQAPKPVLSPETLERVLKESITTNSTVTRKELLKLQQLKLDLNTIIKAPNESTEESTQDDSSLQMILD